MAGWGRGARKAAAAVVRAARRGRRSGTHRRCARCSQRAVVARHQGATHHVTTFRSAQFDAKTSAAHRHARVCAHARARRAGSHQLVLLIVERDVHVRVGATRRERERLAVARRAVVAVALSGGLAGDAIVDDRRRRAEGRRGRLER
eukprot:1516696-Prymnesium_polylepis.1